MKFSKLRKFLVLFLIPLAFVVIFSGTGAVHATTVTPDTGAEEGQVDSVTSDNNDATTLGLSLSTNSDETSLSGTLQILLIITVISLAPSILVMVTSFTRIIIVLHFVRTAIGTQSSPPNNVLIGLSLFLTLFIMSPVIAQIKTEAYDPLVAEEITQQEALERGIQPLREFMLKQTRQDDLRLFMDIAKIEPVESVDELSITIIIPAFIISELRAAFIIGFLIYVPFIVIDMVVSSVLMSMGMMMLPPTTISMPFKILLLTSALASVNQSYYNAARVDGTSKSRIFWRITLPMISPTVFYLIITGFIGAFKQYSDAVALFGTDLNAAGMNTIVGYVYDMLYGNSGGYPSYASAAAILLFVIVLTITVINLLFSRKHTHY